MKTKIDCVYIITFKSDYKELIVKLNKLGLPEKTPYYIFPATVGKNTDLEYTLFDWELKDSDNSWYNRKMTDGEIGCAISHWRVWNDAKENNYDNVLILEEDFEVVSNKTFEYIEYKSDITYLGHNQVDIISKPSTKVYKPGYCYNAHAYILNKHAIDYIIEESNFINNLIPTDEFLAALHTVHPREDVVKVYKPNLNALAYTTDIIKQTSNKNTSSTLNLNTPHNDILNYYDIDAWCNRYVNKYLMMGEYDLITDELIDNVYEFPLFTPEFCNELIILAETTNKWSDSRHANYPTYDVLLDVLGLSELYDHVLKTYVYPLAIHKWQLEGKAWKTMESENFLIRYDLENQGHLSLHHDYSKLSLNVKLNDDFDGGGTYFPKYKYLAQPKKIGNAILHPGQITHRHGARPILFGSRYIIVSFIR